MATSVARKNRRKKRRRGKKAFFLISVIFLILLIGGAVLYTLGATVFFNVKTVDIRGASQYDKQLIIDSSGVTQKDNLIRLSKTEISNRITHALPYIGTAKVEYKFPDTVRITVTECTPDVAYVLDNGYMIASGLKCVERVDALPEGLITVKANMSTTYTVGFDLDLPDDADEALTDLRNTAASAGIDDITHIDVSNTSDLTVICGGKLRLRFGTIDSLDKKMNNAVSIMETERAKYGAEVEGTVDLRYLSNDSNRSYFTRESISQAPSEPVQSQPDNSSTVSSNSDSSAAISSKSSSDVTSSKNS